MLTPYATKFLLQAAAVLALTLSLSSCRKFVTIAPPTDLMVKETVFKDARTAAAALLETYGRINNIYTNSNIPSMPLLNALYPDEYRLTTTNNTLQLIYTLSPDSRDVSFSGVWSNAYSTIFRANAVLEGLAAYGASIEKELREQMIGEAKFLRAYSYFTLTNLYGGVPLLLTTNYEENRKIARSAEAQVYDQILRDLTDARDLLKPDYLDWSNQPSAMRIRATSGAADALMARVYLYREEWAKAEAHADEIIADSETYKLEDVPADAFNINSKETVLAFDNGLTKYPRLASSFLLSSNPNNSTSSRAIGVISDTLLGSFEPGDNRMRDWVGVFITGGKSYYFANKFKVSTNLEQFIPAIRLAEIYLIRAEARLEQNKLEPAIDDLNAIRNRARATATTDVPDPLPALSYNLSKMEIRLAMEKERFTELFVEGHRWFDFKRWKGLNNSAVSRADEAMPGIATRKGTSWDSHLKVLPLPQTELELNKSLIQNKDY